jgi:hypothetical protein
MSGQYHKNPIKKLVSLVGVASASVFLSLPGFAQTAPNAGGMNQPLNNADRQTETDGQLLAQTMGNQGYSTCGGYEGNATSGGGYFCALYRMNPNGGGNLYRTSPQGSSSMGNQGSTSTTGAGYPGNNTRPQGVNDSMNQGSNGSGSNTQDRTSPQGSSTTDNGNSTSPQGSSTTDNGNSTTGAGYPGNGVTPQGQNNQMNR